MSAKIKAMEFGYLLWILVLGLRKTVADNCTGHVSQRSGACYNLFADRVTWAEADKRCRQQGGHLAAFLDPFDQDVLGYLLPGQSPVGGDAVWMGAFHTFGMWTWDQSKKELGPQGCYLDKREASFRDLSHNISIPDVNPLTCIAACKALGVFAYAGVQGGGQCYCGTDFGKYGTGNPCTLRCADQNYYCGGMLMNSVYKIDGAYGIWAYAQPNNHNGNQNCGIISAIDRSKMEDESCYSLRAYICEVFTNNCPGGSSYYFHHSDTGRCFYINESRVTWYQAKQACRTLTYSGRLVEIESEVTYDIIRNITLYAVPVSGEFWIGLYKGIGWQWTTGAPFNFTYWAPASELPGNPISVKTCGIVNVTLGNFWADTNCDALLPYICQNAAEVVTTTTAATTTSPGGSGTTTTTVQLVTPSAGASSDDNSGLNTMELVLAIIMSILGLVLLILLIYCLVMLCNKRDNKVYFAYDARPIAPYHDGGITSITAYDRFSNLSNSSIDSSTELNKPGGPW